MRTGRTAVAAACAALLFVSCSIFGGGGYDPKDPITLHVTVPKNLNEYGDTAHPLDVYVFKVMDPQQFKAADDSVLVSGNAVPGGGRLAYRNFVPGSGPADWDIGAMGAGMNQYRWIGVFAAYHDASGSRRDVIEVPSDARIDLALGARAIASFKPHK